MHLPSWPSDTQWKSAPASRAAGFEIRERLLLDRHDRDVVTQAAGPLQHEKRKPAIAGDEADPGHAVRSGWHSNRRADRQDGAGFG